MDWEGWNLHSNISATESKSGFRPVITEHVEAVVVAPNLVDNRLEMAVSIDVARRQDIETIRTTAQITDRRKTTSKVDPE